VQTPAQVRCAWRAAARTGDFGIRQPKEDGAPEQSDQPEAKRRERRRVALSGAPERSRESGRRGERREDAEARRRWGSDVSGSVYRERRLGTETRSARTVFTCFFSSFNNRPHFFVKF